MLIDPQQPGPSKVKTDWNKCCICQKVTNEVLQCPTRAKRHDIKVGQGYSTLSSNIMRFSELGELPVFLELERLDEGSGIETTLINNKAVWHKLCYNNFNTTKLQRAEKRVIASDSEQENGPAKKYRCRSSFQEMPKDCCFFCGEGPLESLHEAATMHLDSRVRKCARDLQDESLLAKLSVGDMVAIDAKYHLQCLVSLYNRASALSTTRKTDESRKVNEGIALAELLAYIDEMRMNADVAPIFKLSDLVKLYSSRLEYLGIEQHVRPHSTELKNRILAHIPELKAYKEGREVLLAFDSDMGYAIHKFCDEDYDSEAICLAKAAKIVRRDMLELRAMFTGSLCRGVGGATRHTVVCSFVCVCVCVSAMRISATACY